MWQIGAPIVVHKKPAESITQQDIDSLHQKFMNEMTRLFEKTKHKYPESCTKESTLQIL